MEVGYVIFVVNGLDNGEALVVGIKYTCTEPPEVIVPEMPFDEAQVNTGADGTLLHPEMTDEERRHIDSPTD